ncbi:PUL domain-containing protein [Verticillium dahliae]|nr:COPII coat assembly protein sec-16 [Verticillium dahliae VDG2]KAH6698577.1 PUL domain-containing protein [Verticillium dahliae]
MEVALFTYDLSQGLARQMSQGFLGFQLDAIYHTSIHLNGLEYVYDGGIVAIRPGTSHLGRPMQRIPLGTTELPMDVIEEFLDSLRPIFTLEAYDLWKHNCNNFSDSFAKFLVGKGIPDHIINMPQAVMDSPMGRMLLPQLNQTVNSMRQNGGILGIQNNAAAQPQSTPSQPPKSKVVTAGTMQELSAALETAKTSCAVVFFTMSTCGPCKMLYPEYEQLAVDVADKAVLIKIDINRATDVATTFNVRAAPTFATFVHGEKQYQWTGATPHALREKVQLLVQMAWPRHPHELLNLPSFVSPGAKPVLYTKVPPLQKLLAKMGDAASDPAVQAIRRFIESRDQNGPSQAVLPDMRLFVDFLRRSTQTLSKETFFAVTDLLRCALIDPRVSGHFAEEHDHQTLNSIIGLVNTSTDAPYALRLMTLQAACNLFSTQLYADQILQNELIREPVVQLISSSFLDDNHNNVRVAASSLMYNVALASSNAKKTKSGDGLPEAEQVELAASVLEAIGQEEASPEALQGMLLALGHLVYCTAIDGELADLLRTMDAEATVLGKKKLFPKEKLVVEVGSELLGKGLKRT